MTNETKTAKEREREMIKEALADPLIRPRIEILLERAKRIMHDENRSIVILRNELANVELSFSMGRYSLATHKKGAEGPSIRRIEAKEVGQRLAAWLILNAGTLPLDQRARDELDACLERSKKVKTD